MQDIHSIGGGSRLFGGGGGDRRLRPQHHNHHQSHQALKCPRCDSLNTKFCYYNNYNLSQPRHFCKSCRRYWTKGGVLRNVPVGGGCRKTKRNSKQKVASEAAPVPPLAPVLEPKDNSNSSSESSSLTATTTAAATEAFSAPSSSSASKLLSLHESKFFVAQSANPNFEASTVLEQGTDCGIFSEIRSFTSLITSTNETLPFGFGNISDMTPFTLNQPGEYRDQFRGQHNHLQPPKLMSGHHEELRMNEITMGLLDPSQGDLSALQNRSSNAGFGSLDWQAGGDQGLFDLPNVVDQAYWSQSQWTDRDHASLYRP